MCIEDNPDGTPGQAERSGMVFFGSQVVSLGGRSVIGMSMKELRKLVSTAPRPVTIGFQKMVTSSGAPLVAPPNITAAPAEAVGPRQGRTDDVTKSQRRASKSPSRQKVLNMLRHADKLETAGLPYAVRFRKGVIGLKIANAKDRVIVSGK